MLTRSSVILCQEVLAVAVNLNLLDVHHRWYKKDQV